MRTRYAAEWIIDMVSSSKNVRCPICRRTVGLDREGNINFHGTIEGRCSGSGKPQDVSLDERKKLGEMVDIPKKDAETESRLLRRVAERASDLLLAQRDQKFDDLCGGAPRLEADLQSALDALWAFDDLNSREPT